MKTLEELQAELDEMQREMNEALVTYGGFGNIPIGDPYFEMARESARIRMRMIHAKSEADSKT